MFSGCPSGDAIFFFFILHWLSQLSFSLHISQVSNTPWLEMHSYVLSHTSASVMSEVCEDEGRLSFHFRKEFHVSPFMDMDHRYNFAFSDLKGNTQVYITMHKDDDLYFDAKVSLSGRRVPLITHRCRPLYPELSPSITHHFFSSVTIKTVSIHTMDDL